MILPEITTRTGREGERTAALNSHSETKSAHSTEIPVLTTRQSKIESKYCSTPELRDIESHELVLPKMPKTDGQCSTQSTAKSYPFSLESRSSQRNLRRISRQSSLISSSTSYDGNTVSSNIISSGSSSFTCSTTKKGNLNCERRGRSHTMNLPPMLTKDPMKNALFKYPLAYRYFKKWSFSRPPFLHHDSRVAEEKMKEESETGSRNPSLCQLLSRFPSSPEFAQVLHDFRQHDER